MEERCVCNINDKKIVDPEAKKHMENRENPHGVTAEQIGARPENWMPNASEVGAAPDGFGLGYTVGKSTDDCNNAVNNGWYEATKGCLNVPYYDEESKNIPLYYGILFVFRRWNAIHQYYYNTTSGVRSVCHRYSADDGTTWTDWEWINPHMAPGVEYRTAEVSNGSPVYAKLISTKATASTTTTATLDIPHGIENFGQCIRCSANIGASPLPIIEQTGNISVYWVNDTNVRLRLNNYSHTKSLAIRIYYTKK